MTKAVNVVQPLPPEEEIPMDVLAKSITQISMAASALRRSGLGENAVILLLSDKSKLSKRQCKTVLDAMIALKATYLTARKAGER